MSPKNGQPTMDPYDVLGVSFGASDAEIVKAYRQLVLKLHPDKQKSNVSPALAEEIAKRWHDVQEAQSFLLDPEHAEDRRKFDAKRESDRLRRHADEVRERGMSERRKRMRDELREKELQARQGKQKAKQKHDEDDLINRLRREGKKRREAHAERDAEEELKREIKKEREQRKDSLEERQVRLKWDRKKISISPSEDSIASLFSQFGTVEHVEFLGSKGNQALITFADAASCRPCVGAYATSQEMRAKYVGKRKEREEVDVEVEEIPSKPVSDKLDNETLEDRRRRQAAEREALLRQMEEEEGSGSVDYAATRTEKSTQASKVVAKSIRIPFPIPFPNTEELQGMSPLQKLETMEQRILKELLSPDELKSISATQ